MRPRPGDLISGKYRLIRLIGDGGMGSVYEARHEYLGTAVALKFVHAELARRPGLVQRFLQEARLAATIRSQHIARVTDVNQSSDGAAYLVMELLQGESLQSVLDRQRKLSRDLALDYTMQMLAGLEAAHAMGAVHRDLKPDNVFIEPTPQGPLVKLLDFGIAKLRTSREFQVGLTRPGVMMGTPEYMAPEQAFSADVVDESADIFAVGVMLFEMLVGDRPVHGDDPQQIARLFLENKVTYLRQLDPSVPEPLAQIIHRAMAPMPAQRWASAPALRDALAPFCGELSIAGRIAATPPPGAGGTPRPVPAVSVARETPTDTAPDDGSPPQVSQVDPRATTSPMERMGAYARGATQAQPAISYGQTAAYAAPVRARRGPSGMLIGILVALLGAAAVIVVVVVMATNQPDKPVKPAPIVVNTAPLAVEPSATATVTTVAPIAAPIALATTTHTVRTTRDAGAAHDAAPEPALTFPPIPFPIPSQLPPLPSTLPPLPSGFPTLPFPFPGAAPSARPSAPR